MCAPYLSCHMPSLLLPTTSPSFLALSNVGHRQLWTMAGAQSPGYPYFMTPVPGHGGQYLQTMVGMGGG